MKVIKSRNFADRKLTLDVTVYGFTRSESRQLLAKEIKKALRKYQHMSKEEEIEYKITLD